jgi:excisionase family DNA binding protein
MATQRPLLTSAEAAAILGVEQPTVNKWAAEGRLPVAMKLPGLRGHNLFRPEDVEALRDARAAAAAAADHDPDEPNGAVAV